MISTINTATSQPATSFEKGYLITQPTLPGQELARQIKLTTTETLPQVNKGNVTTDYRLARADDATKRVGAGLLAVLAGLGSGSLVLASRELTGALAWFSVGMAAAPFVINKVIQANTGLNMGHEYVTSYNGGEERTSLLFNPEYIPSHYLPDNERDAFAKAHGLGNVATNEAETARYEEALRKRIVQRNTLWMLAAGPMTALATALTCHTAEPFLNKALPRAKAGLASLQIQVANLLGKGQAGAVTHLTHTLVGENNDAMLTLWWRQLGPNVANTLGLPKHPEVMRHLTDPTHPKANEAQLNRILAQHLLELPADKHSALQTTLSEFAQRTLGMAKQYEATTRPAEDTARKHLWQLAETHFPDKVKKELKKALLKQHGPETTFDTTATLRQWFDAMSEAEQAKAKPFEQALNTVVELAKQRRTVTHRLLDALNSVDALTHASQQAQVKARQWEMAQLKVYAEPATAKAILNEQVALLNTNRYGYLFNYDKAQLSAPRHQMLSQRPLQELSNELLGVLSEYKPTAQASAYEQWIARQQKFFHHLTASGSMGAPVKLLTKEALKDNSLTLQWRHRAAALLGGATLGTGVATWALTRPVALPKLAEPSSSPLSARPNGGQSV
jgi:hypothetical protein